jgi:galactofuranosylgalactofuranosylrhamnosyl-N-acetylglucosaminyl-diphospho-decaprenol beta-1,5/1,6-galactofuranosyltransferase
MAEALQAGRSDYVLLLDDDVALHEPESIRRALAFADLARTPTIVGGHMLDLLQRCTLNLYAETVQTGRWWPGPAEGTAMGHNLAKGTLADTPWLHRRADADFTGWWLCLVPLPVIRAVGLTLPAFIKWDDVEYGLRAAAAGYPTVTLPGAAIWHMPWYAKNTATDPLVYFQARNRLIAALAHRAGEPGSALLRESLFLGLKYALTLQFSAAEVVLLALSDVLRGPERLHDELPADLGRVADLVASFPDAGGKAALAKRHPELVLPFTGDPWWAADDLDAVLVTSADGVGGGWGDAERDRFRTLVRRLRAVHDELETGWAGLSERYRKALPDLVSPDRWRATFATSGR